MQAVPAAGRFADQVVVIQLVETPAGDLQVGVVHGRGGVGVDIGAGVQAEPAEQALLADGQILVRQVERGCHRDVFGLHGRQPVTGRGQLSGQVGDRPGWMMAQSRRHQPDRQRQIAAQPGHPADRGIGGLQAWAVGQSGEQVRGLAGRQRAQADRRRLLQRGQPAAAGDQHQAACRPRQQRADLIAAGGVIEHQQHFLVGQVPAPRCRPGLEAWRICCGTTPAVSGKVASASAGSTGRCPAVCACRRRKICPSGKRAASRWAVCTANVVLPIPAIPCTAWTPITPPTAALSQTAATSWSSSWVRPVNAAVSRGSVRAKGRPARSRRP